MVQQALRAYHSPVMTNSPEEAGAAPETEDARRQRLDQLNKDGYLGDGVQQGNREHFRKTHAPWFECIFGLNRLAMKQLPAYVPPVGDNQKIVGWALATRSVLSVQAATLLVERGLVGDARTILRSIVETLIVLAGVIDDPQIVDKLEIREAFYRRKQLAETLADTRVTTSVLTKEQVDGFRAELSALDTNYPALPKNDPIEIAGLARKTDMIGLYTSTYRGTSTDALHVTKQSIMRLFKELPGGGSGFSVKAKPTEVTHTLYDLFNVLNCATTLAAELSGGHQFDSERDLILKCWWNLGVPAEYKPIVY
jgi:hypothetical protein